MALFEVMHTSNGDAEVCHLIHEPRVLDGAGAVGDSVGAHCGPDAGRSRQFPGVR